MTEHAIVMMQQVYDVTIYVFCVAEHAINKTVCLVNATVNAICQKASACRILRHIIFVQLRFIIFDHDAIQQALFDGDIQAIGF